MEFEKLLKACRKESGYTIKQLAKECHISSQYLTDLENGNTDAYSEGVLYKLAQIFKLNGDAFVIKSGRIPTWATQQILKRWDYIKVELITE